MKTSMSLRIIITLFCIALILCVLFGESVINVLGLRISNTYLSMITGEDQTANSEFVAFLKALLVAAPICILLIWIRQKFLPYVAMLISGGLGIYDFIGNYSWAIEKKRTYSEAVGGGYSGHLLVIIPILISIFCLFLILSTRKENKKKLYLEDTSANEPEL